MTRRRRTTAVWAVLGLLLVGCAGDPPLLDERRIEPYRSLLCESAGLQRSTTRIVTGGARDGRVDVALHEVEAAASPSPSLVVLVHGLYASAPTWRFVVPYLARHHDLLLVDLPGCGASDKPDPEALGPDAYTPDWLAARVAAALDVWTRRRQDVRPIVLVGHSLGGLVVLRLAGSPVLRGRYPALVSRFSHLALVSTPDVIQTEPTEPIRKIGELEGLTMEIGKVTGLFERGVEDVVRSGRHDPGRTALQTDADQFGEALADVASRRAGQAMLKRYSPWRPDGSLDVEAARRREAETAAIRLSALVLWGAEDDVVGPERIAPLVGRLPTSRAIVVPNTRHSPQLEKPDVVAEAIERLLAGGQG